MSWKWYHERPWTLTLGDKVKFPNGREFVFCRVTPKGFNFIDLKNYVSLSPSRHFYDGSLSGKDIPKGRTKFKVRLPDWVIDNLVETKEKA